MINRYLDDIRTRIYEIHDRLVREGKPISAVILRDLYLVGKDEDQKMLIAIFTEHNDKMKSLEAKDIPRAR